MLEKTSSTDTQPFLLRITHL